MRKRCTRTVSLLSVLFFMGLPFSMAAQIPVARGRLDSPARDSTQGLVVILEGIGGPDPRNLCNLATAQARLNRLAEAEQLARAALRLDSGYLKASLILGSILVDEPATRREGLQHLEKAATEFAFVRQYIEQLRASR